MRCAETNEESISFVRGDLGDLNDALNRLDVLADDVAFLLCHNLIRFDLPHLKAVLPDLRLYGKPAVDTLWLNPLAFPRNPYRHLVECHKDGRLQGGGRQLGYDTLGVPPVPGGGRDYPAAARYHLYRSILPAVQRAPRCQKEINALVRAYGISPGTSRPKHGEPLQQKIVEVAMAGQNVLGTLPIGTGKSSCYQVPALSRFEKIGALTVVISPLVALIAYQVAGLSKYNVVCAALNGIFSMSERNRCAGSRASGRHRHPYRFAGIVAQLGC